METMNDTIYPGQEFFRIVHEGERAGLYRVEVLPTGKEEATLLGAPLMVEVVADEAGDGRALAMEWLDPNGTRHTLTLPEKMLGGRRIRPIVRRMVRGGWRCFLLGRESILMFSRFLVAAWNTERGAGGHE